VLKNINIYEKLIFKKILEYYFFNKNLQFLYLK
jgi:hypothetical protein